MIIMVKEIMIPSTPGFMTLAIMINAGTIYNILSTSPINAPENRYIIISNL
jgi:hypothetical protein